MKRILFAFALVGFWSSPSLPSAFARIGENRADIEARYGKPVEPPRTAERGPGDNCTYHYGGFEIVVRFIEGISAGETFSRLPKEGPPTHDPVERMERLNRPAITREEAVYLLDLNSANQPWRQVPAIAAGWIAWERNDGALSAYLIPGPGILASLSIRTQRLVEMVEAQDPKIGAQTKLKGF